LRQQERRLTGEKTNRSTVRYCRAYHLTDMQQFPNWFEDGIETPGAGQEDQADDCPRDIVFVHQDYTVTGSRWPGEEVIFNRVTPEWVSFCFNTLGFRVPDDLDLVPGTDAQGSIQSLAPQA
jgi:hypothetical protein